MRFAVSGSYSYPGINTPEGVLKFFAPAHNFIDEHLDAGHNVMVHCLAGAHRAGTTGVSYLMKAGQMKYLQARQIAKARRPAVDPFAGLEELLYKLEAAYDKYGYDSSPAIKLRKPTKTIGMIIDLDLGSLKMTVDGDEQSFCI